MVSTKVLNFYTILDHSNYDLECTNIVQQTGRANPIWNESPGIKGAWFCSLQKLILEDPSSLWRGGPLFSQSIHVYRYVISMA